MGVIVCRVFLPTKAETQAFEVRSMTPHKARDSRRENRRFLLVQQNQLDE